MSSNNPHSSEQGQLSRYKDSHKLSPLPSLPKRMAGNNIGEEEEEEEKEIIPITETSGLVSKKKKNDRLMDMFIFTLIPFNH